MTGSLVFVVNEAGFFLSHRAPIALAARAAGLEVHVATPAGPGTERIRQLGFPFHELPISRRSLAPWDELAGVAALAALYRKIRPSIAHHVTIKPVLYGSLAARLTGVPAVVNAVSGLGWVFLARGARAAALRLAVSVAYRLALARPRMRTIFQNPDDRDAFVARGLVRPGDAVLIRGSGVDPQRFVPTPEPEGLPVVVLAGRMLWDKGIGELVGAAARLRGRARFVLVGDSDVNRAAIPVAQLRAWQEQGVVEWWGRREDMPAVLSGAHIACLPSYREGVPKFLIEAAASGRAIVATDVPGCREIVRHGDNGLLVPVRDAAALAGALRRLLDDPAGRARMGVRGRQLVESDFTLEHVIRATLAIYRELLP